MSTLLEIVTAARELQHDAEREFRRAVIRAREGRHSLAEIGSACNPKMTRQAIRWILLRENGSIDGYGKPLEKEEK